MGNLFSNLMAEEEKQRRLVDEQRQQPISDSPASESDTRLSKTEGIIFEKGEEPQGIPAQKKERLQESKKSFFLAFVRSFLEMKSATTVSFRYPDDLLEQLEEALYRIKREHKRKLTKNAVLVAALAYFIHDYQENGKKSALFRSMLEE